jgi:transcriptional regulator with XRE-family HTH domain
VTRHAGDPFNLKHTISRDTPPLIDGPVRDTERSCNLNAHAPVKSGLRIGHGVNDSSTINNYASGMLGALSGLLQHPCQNGAMSERVRPRFKQGPPRHYIREWRKARGYTLEELAEIVGVTHGAISQLERGVVAYTQGSLEAIAEALACEPHELVMAPPDSRRGIFVAIDNASDDDKEAVRAMVSAYMTAKSRKLQSG